MITHLLKAWNNTKRINMEPANNFIQDANIYSFKLYAL
jgi:hypothetical protein